MKSSRTLTYLAALIFLWAGSVYLYRQDIIIESAASLRSVSLWMMPKMLLLSFVRMFVSYLVSLASAFVLGIFAAKSRLGERVILPLIDIFQSVPVVGFFPAAVTFFISVSNGHRIGIELAACFLIFTSQAWNLAFGVYEAIKSGPGEQNDAIESFGVKASQKFWLYYAPLCVPRLVYNSILSWSNGWFFLVACEIIAMGSAKYYLPGIGSFLALSAEQGETFSILMGLAALTLFILMMDQIIWRPLSSWAERFKQDDISDEGNEEYTIPSFLEPIASVLGTLLRPFYWFLKSFLFPILIDFPFQFYQKAFTQKRTQTAVGILLGVGAILTSLFALHQMILWLWEPWPPIVSQIPLAILASTGRLIVALALSLSWVIPLILFCWNRSDYRNSLMTIAQIGASLPAIALFPLFLVTLVEKVHVGMETASVLLLLMGMQWYLLFNGLSGAALIPAQLKEVTRSFGLTPFQKWKRLVFPAMRPALVTGGITAWGGGWNALVVAEYIHFKGEVLSVNGIGALLNYSVYQLGDTRAMSFCIVAMIAWILLINFIFWQPLYRYSVERYKLES